MPCPRCNGTGSVFAAGNRIARPCPSCEGKGVITEFDASFDAEGREIARLENQVRDLTAKLELRESCLRAYSVRIHELFDVSIVSPESWDNIPHCLAIVKLRMDEQKAENARERAASVLVEAERDRLRVECERLGNAVADARWSVQP